MNSQEMVRKIDDAKDSNGVITPQALHDQLSGLTAADWKQASSVFSPINMSPDGFFISDESNGQVIIHNDLSDAKLHATSALSPTLEDAKSIGIGALAGTGIISASWGLSAGYGAWADAEEASWGTSMLDPAVTSTALSSAGDAALVGGGVIATIGLALGQLATTFAICSTNLRLRMTSILPLCRCKQAHSRL